MQFLLLAGSFHSRSYTHALLDVVTDLLAPHQCVRPPLHHLPFYSEDLDGTNKPDLIVALLAEVQHCDGIIVCSPEYNHSIPAVLKNAIDWASRPAFKSPLKDKPVTIITQAQSPVGGARAQAHIKLVFDSTLSLIHPCHEMMITEIKGKFDAQMQLTDVKTRERLQRHVGDFLGWMGVRPTRA
jgi:chromate reductase, NAD(P)H dehydrogenase (quinone)